MDGQRITWTVSESYRALFSASVLDGIVSGSIVSRETVARRLANRRVSLLELVPEHLPDIYVKAYSIRPGRLYRSVLKPYGLKEWRVARALGERGIRTCPPIALGVEKRRGFYRRTYFITEAVPESMTLKEYMERHAGERDAARRLVDGFAAFAAGIRRVGIMHSDFHWGNVLVVIRDSAPCFYLIDLHNVTLLPRPIRDGGVSNLALLNASFFGKIPARTHLDFLRVYLKDMLRKRKDFFRFRNRVRSKTEKLLARRWKKHAGRSLHVNKYFAAVAVNGLRGYARRDGRMSGVLRLMQSPDGLFAEPQAAVIKDSRTTSSLVRRERDGICGFHLKRFNIKSPLYGLVNSVRLSRARKGWYAAHGMLARDVPTPRPIMYLEQRSRTGLLGRSYLLTELIPSALTLEDYIAARFTGLSHIRKLELVREIAVRVRTMHERGIGHGDLKAKNVLVQERDGGGINIFFVDLDSVRIADRLSFRRRCRDIARLNCSFPDRGLVSETHRLYFLKCYLGRAGRAELKRTWNRVLLYTGRKLRASGRSFYGGRQSEKQS